MQEDKLHQLALTLIPGLGDVLIKNLISYIGNAKEVFQVPIYKLLKVPGIGPTVAREIQKSAVLQEAETQLSELRKRDIRLYFYTDKHYPERLKHIYDAPSLLYLKGNVDLNHQRILAVVGTRKATIYGKEVVASLVEGLKALNVLIVSGLAYGIDIEAHKSALANQIPTLAVIASGADIIYPALHKKYANKMIANGGILSEYPLGTTPEPARFPARNRIIAGLADATLVIEAAEKGGALITAELAAGYDREVFTIPGRPGDNYSKGCNNLIKNNIAQLITSVEDIGYYMQWDNTADVAQNLSTSLNEDDFDKKEWQIIETIKKGNSGMHIDEISWKSQVQISQLASILLKLEFEGIVNSLPGKKYSLK